MEVEFPKRKRNRLKNRDYDSCGVYFLTICTAERRNYFWNTVDAAINCADDVILSPYGEIVREAINHIHTTYSALTVERCVIMPDHVHLLLANYADEYGRPMVAPTMSRVVKQMKGYVTKQVGYSIWQKSFFDHIIRNRQDYEEHVKYIFENPARWYHHRSD